MSGTLAPTSEQSGINFIGIDDTSNQSPLNFSPTLAKKQYLAGGNYGLDVNTILTRSSDKLRRTKGDNIIDEMLCDPEIKKCDTIIKIAVLNDGITFSPAVHKPSPIAPLAPGEKETPEQIAERLTRTTDLARFEKAKQYADFATRAIKNLDTPIRTVMENMLDAVTYGNKVAEQTYREEFDPIFGKTVLTLDSIRVKPRNTTRFVVDKFNKLLGFQAFITENGESKSVILPREKFLVLTFRGKDGDPRGESILQAVYNAWYLKMLLWPEYLRWLIQSSLPSLVGTTAPLEPGQTPNVLRDSVTNEIIKDSAGNPIYESDVNSLLNSLTQLRNASAIALPHGATVTPINNSVSGDPFKGMRDVLNEEIEMGMILQTLASSEGRFMSRAASQSHMSILDLFVFFIKGLVIDMLEKDLLKPLMKLNFADFDNELLPIISMGDSERRDWATDVIAIATGWKAGFFSESQKPGLDKIIGAPERDMASDRRAAEASAALAAVAKTATSATNTKTTPTTPPTSKPVPKSKPTTPSSTTTVLEGIKELLEVYEPFDGE